MRQQTFIKKGKLIVLVDLKEESLKIFEKQLIELGYGGEMKSFSDLGIAVIFLESIRAENGQLDHADLILCGYDV